MHEHKPEMDSSMMQRTRILLLSMPVFVLLFTRAGIEVAVRALPLHYSWILADVFYYVSIILCLLYARRKLGVAAEYGSLSASTFPKPKLLIFGVLFPAIIPVWVFIRNVNAVPPRFLIYPIISHALVDVFNLSVAVFFGMKLTTL